MAVRCYQRASFNATWSAPRPIKNPLRQKRRNNPVRRIHDLAHLEVDRDAAEDVGLFAAQAALAHEVVDHVAHRLPGAFVEVGAVRRRRIARATGGDACPHA